MSINFVSLNTDAVFRGLNLSSKEMPINPTGNKELERANIENSEDIRKTQGLSDLGRRIYESQKTDVDKEPEGNVPWSAIMKQLQLKCTENEEEDFNNIMEELEFQIAHAQSRYDYNYYQWLMEHTVRIFMSIEDADRAYEEENFEENCYLKQLSNMAAINMSML